MAPTFVCTVNGLRKVVKRSFDRAASLCFESAMRLVIAARRDTFACTLQL